MLYDGFGQNIISSYGAYTYFTTTIAFEEKSFLHIFKVPVHFHLETEQHQWQAGSFRK